MWQAELRAHAAGEFSMAAAQANVEMEDQGQVMEYPDATLVGVYDGHGGPDASRFLRSRLFPLVRGFASERGDRRRDPEGVPGGRRGVPPDGPAVATQYAKRGRRGLLLPPGRHFRRHALCRQRRRLTRHPRAPRHHQRWSGRRRAALHRAQRGLRGGPEGARGAPPRRRRDRGARPRRMEGEGDHPGVAVDRRRVPQDAGVQAGPRSPTAVLPRHQADAIGSQRQAVHPCPKSQSGGPVRHLRIRRPMGAPLRRRGGAVGVQEPKKRRSGVAGAAALKEAARKREVRRGDLRRIERGVRRHFHDDITAVVVFLDSRRAPSRQGRRLELQRLQQHTARRLQLQQRRRSNNNFFDATYAVLHLSIKETLFINNHPAYSTTKILSIFFCS